MVLTSISNALPEFSSFYHDRIQAELKEIIDGNPSALYNMLRYHMGWQDEHGRPYRKKSGKFMRPTLCLLSCQAVEGNVLQILPAAAALELIHNWSLIHDDIEDAGYERHHRPTVWKLWGQSQAINAGDAMFTLAYLGLLKLKDNGIADKKIAHSIQMLTEAVLQLCEGQYLDITYESRRNVTIEDYLDMIAKKTAALMATSTSLGAYLGSEDGKLIDSFYLFGKELGIAYQIRDDILGIWGTEDNTGKSANDISQKKKTLPVVYGLQNSNHEEGERLLKLYSQQSIQGEHITEVLSILDRLGARDYAQDLVRQHCRQALAQLGTTGLDPSRQAPLREITHFLLERGY